MIENKQINNTTSTTPNPQDYIVINYRVHMHGRAIYRGEEAQAIREHMRNYPEDTFYETIECLVSEGILDAYPEELSTGYGDDNCYEYDYAEDGTGEMDEIMRAREEE